MSTLFCGPWFGEFGLEIIWAAGARYAAHLREFDKVIACSWPGHEALYADFADEYVAHDIQCIACGAHGIKGTQPSPDTIHAYIPHGATLFPAVETHVDEEHAGNVFKPPMCSLDGKHNLAEFVRYGTRRSCFQDALVLHARNRSDWGEDRNWPPARWTELGRELKDHRLISIGSRDGAYRVAGSEDMRGIPLADLMDLLASARLIVGPSSGPMHLAALCGTPMVVWVGYTGRKQDILIERYATAWNPHATPLTILVAEQWMPSAATVAENVRERLGARIMQAPQALAAPIGIAVLAFHKPGLLASAVHSIRRHTRVAYDLLVFDNSGRDDTSVRDWTHAHAADAAYFRPGENMGCAAARNIIAQYFLWRKHPAFVIMDHDVEVTAAGWCEDMLAKMNRHADAGIVGWRLANEQTAKRDLPPSGETPEVAGMCQLHRAEAVRAVAEKFGTPWCEEYFPFHSFDTDFCLCARKLGWKTYLVMGEQKIRHEHPHSSTRRGRSEVLARSQAILKRRIRELGLEQPANA